jgi:hypothetical protein
MKGDAKVIEHLNKVLYNETYGHQPIFPAREDIRELGSPEAIRARAQGIRRRDEARGQTYSTDPVLRGTSQSAGFGQAYDRRERAGSALLRSQTGM